jgi:hypothetical protein
LFLQTAHAAAIARLPTKMLCSEQLLDPSVR